MNKGTFLERLTAIIEETVQGSENIKVFHNVKMEDKLGNTRQIDVLIEYTLNDRTTFRTIIECKHKSRDRVEINQISAFKGTLESLPDVHRGIFVSNNGFQKGAISVAKDSNIILYTLDDLKPGDLGNCVKGKPVVSKTEKKYELSNWRLLIKEEDIEKLPENVTIDQNQVLIKDDGEEIILKDLLSIVVPYRANELHNELLKAQIAGQDVYGGKYINISAFPLQKGIFLHRGDVKIPVGYIELRILFWFEKGELKNTDYKLYKDHTEAILADVIVTKIDDMGKDVSLSVVGDATGEKRGYYLINDETGITRLDIDKEFRMPEINQTTVIVKSPWKKGK